MSHYKRILEYFCRALPPCCETSRCHCLSVYTDNGNADECGHLLNCGKSTFQLPRTTIAGTVPQGFSNVHGRCGKVGIMKELCFTLLIVFMLSPCAFGQEYRDITPDDKVHIPDDFFYKKDYKVQWWYFTGHLFDAAGREFGYELTFFVVGVQKREYTSRFAVNNIYITHFAISDVGEKRFYFFDRADSGAFEYSGAQASTLRMWLGKDSLEGTTEKMHIRAADKDKSIDLVLEPAKPLVLNGQNGYSRKSEDSPLNASLYFSYTNLRTAGQLRIGDSAFTVKGKSWFDREISTKGLGKNETGWDWFAVQLDDGREVMLYVLRKGDGSIGPYSAGTLVYADGTSRHLSKDDFKITVMGHYTSKKTGARYPAQWEAVIPSEKILLKIIPLMRDQECIGTHSTLTHYWEGTARVEGTARGRAYVEMTGY